MELIRAFGVQQRVISALIMREVVSRYANNKLGFFWALFEPFAHVVVFMGIFTAMGRHSPVGDNIGLFILTGIIPWLLYNNVVSSVMNAVNANKALLGYPQVMPLDIVLARVLLDFATLLIVMLIFLGLFISLGTKIRIDDFLLLMNIAGLLVLAGLGMGLLNTAIIYYAPSWGNIYKAITQPLYFMSGIFYTADFLSPDVYNIVAYNPLLHIIDWFRTAFFKEYESQLIDYNYALAFSIGTFSLGLLVERLTRKRARIK